MTIVVANTQNTTKSPAIGFTSIGTSSGDGTGVLKTSTDALPRIHTG
jgi:type V secretory pathway adhesin AidA